MKAAKSSARPGRPPVSRAQPCEHAKAALSRFGAVETNQRGRAGAQPARRPNQPESAVQAPSPETSPLVIDPVRLAAVRALAGRLDLADARSAPVLARGRRQLVSRRNGEYRRVGMRRCLALLVVAIVAATIVAGAGAAGGGLGAPVAFGGTGFSHVAPTAAP